MTGPMGKESTFTGVQLRIKSLISIKAIFKKGSLAGSANCAKSLMRDRPCIFIRGIGETGKGRGKEKRTIIWRIPCFIKGILRTISAKALVCS